MFRRVFIVSLLAAGLAACGVSSGDPRPDMPRSYELSTLNFAAQPGLSVSEAGNFYPVADIVWRGDAPGDRVAQIGAMFQEAAAQNRGTLGGNQPVVVDIVLERFHGVTERTQFSVGGVHNIVFQMTVRDARTGAIIEGPRRVVANLDEPGGSESVRLDEIGQDQRVRVVAFLASTLRAELM